jgi:catechol 2,3-dioxygenase-like lactoylglutathione lyase family enzyme
MRLSIAALLDEPRSVLFSGTAAAGFRRSATAGPFMSTPPRIASLGHVGIFVEDVERSLAFYRDLLGLTVTDADVENGLYFLSARPDEEHHEFLICRGRSAPRDARLLQQVSFRCATLEDVVAYWERFKAAGVVFDRVVSHGNAVGMYFFDPDGNRCEVYWPTGLQARQTFLAQIDLSRPVDELLGEIKRYVDRYGGTGYVDPVLLRN